jgi:cytoskeletal protein CcmA (bactofilin family)
VSYFSQSKGERDKSSVDRVDREARLDDSPASGKSSLEIVSTLGRGMLVTGNITCVGSMQILGRVKGDIHATNVSIGEGAHVDGNVTAQEAIIYGSFKGTIHANSVKLQSTAVVDGEIFNKSLTIEQNAQFEGVARRLEKAVEPPSSEQPKGGNVMSSAMADVVPFSEALR